MNDIDFKIRVWNILQTIFNISKGKTIKEIYIKKKLLHTGGKYKWCDGIEYSFMFKEIALKASFIKTYEDTNDYKPNSLIIKEDYNIYKIKGVNNDNLITFLNSKLRILKIEMFLNDLE